MSSLTAPSENVVWLHLSHGCRSSSACRRASVPVPARAGGGERKALSPSDLALSCTAAHAEAFTLLEPAVVRVRIARMSARRLTWPTLACTRAPPLTFLLHLCHSPPGSLSCVARTCVFFDFAAASGAALTVLVIGLAGGSYPSSTPVTQLHVSTAEIR